MTVLVTGANGFIGRHTVDELLRRNRSVRAALRSPDDLPCETAVVGNIDRNTDWTQAVTGAEQVIHLAGRAHILDRKGRNAESVFHETNVDGTIQLASAAALNGVRRFIFVSSIGVHGTATTKAPLNENSPFHPANAYARSKLAAEESLWELGAKSEMEIVILRPALVYGPGNPGNFLRLIQLVKSGIPLPFASVRNRRAMIYIDNLVDLLATCLDHPAAAGQAFVVCDKEQPSTPRIIELIADGLMQRPRLSRFPPGLLRLLAGTPGLRSLGPLVNSLHVDTTKLSSLLQWQSPISLHQGVLRTAEAHR